MVQAAVKLVLAAFLLVNCSSTEVDKKLIATEDFKNEVGHRDERCPLVNPKQAKLLPHEEECSYYYICESGIAILRECPDNLHFNPKKLVCDFADRAGCELDQAPIKFRSLSFGFPHPDCPLKNPKKPVLLPNPSECGKFYICDGGLAYEKTCQSGLHFNPKMQVCDFQRNVNCDNVDSSLDGNDDEIHPGCPTKNSGKPVYLPHPNDCTKFFVCDNGQSHLKECKIGLHFNPKLKVCDFPENVHCSNTKGKSFKEGHKASPGIPSPFCPTINGKYPIFYRHPTNCSIYYMCGNGLAYEFVCPSGLHFNESENVCDNPMRAQCSVTDN